MRVLVIGATPIGPESGYWFWLKAGMEAVGHQVIALDILSLTALFGVGGMQEIVIEAARVGRVQVMIIPPQTFMEPWCLAAIKAAGVALVSFRFDDCMVMSAHQIGDYPPRFWSEITHLDAHGDLSVTVSRTIGPHLATMGLQQPEYLPYPYGWQALPYVEEPLRPVIAFCGSPKVRGREGWRVRVVRALHEAGLPVELHHGGWAKVPGLEACARPTPDVGGLFRVMRTATVNLALTAEGHLEPYAGIKGLNLEIAAAGGAQVTQPAAEVSDIFEIGQEVLTASTTAQCVDAARYLLAHPEAARTLGRRSRRALERGSGWDRWWEKVAGLLAERGVDLDLSASPPPPARSETRWLATCMTALAHALESKGDSAQADVYFGMALDWDPGSYAASAGRARLAMEAAAAQPLWRQAAHAVGMTPPAFMPCPLGMKAINPRNSTHFRFDAAVGWCRTSLETRQYDEALDALALCAVHDRQMAGAVATHFHSLGRNDLALRAVGIGLEQWPDDRQLVTLRDLLLGRSGQD